MGSGVRPRIALRHTPSGRAVSHFLTSAVRINSPEGTCTSAQPPLLPGDTVQSTVFTTLVGFFRKHQANFIFFLELQPCEK